MDGADGGGRPVWDGRGGIRPERVARRKRLAAWATVIALAVAVPTVVGSSAGWWSGGAERRATAEAGPGVRGAGVDGAASLVGDPLGAAGGDGAVDDGAGRAAPGPTVGLDGELLDAGFDPGSGCEVGPGGEPVRIGLIVDGRQDLSAAAPGEGTGEVALEVAAARRLAELANCGGGVLGRSVEVVPAEAAGSALAISDAVAGLVEQGVSVIIGPPAVAVALQVAEAAGPVPVLVPWSIEPALDDHDRGLFLIDPDVTVLADAAARLLADRGWRRVVLFTGSSSLDDLAGVTLGRSLSAGRGEVVAELPLIVGDDGEVDLAGQLDRLGVGPLSSFPPDAVVTTADSEVAVELAAALDRAGVEVPVVAIDRRDSGLRDGRVREGVEIVGRWPVEPGSRADRLSASLDLGTGPDNGGGGGAGGPDPMAAARVADAVLVALDAIHRAGVVDPDAVSVELRLAPALDGVSGRTGVWPSRDDGSESVPIPVVGSGPDGQVLVASLEPRAG